MFYVEVCLLFLIVAELKALARPMMLQQSFLQPLKSLYVVLKFQPNLNLDGIYMIDLDRYTDVKKSCFLQFEL